MSRILITGASGNVGTALLRRLAGSGHEVVGLSRRRPPAVQPYEGVEWVRLDLGRADAEFELARRLHDIDTVVHLAWLIQPAHARELLRRVNQDGTRAVVDASRKAGVSHFVHMSSVGTYGPISEPGVFEWADETWPTIGISSSSYSVDKAAAERIVDSLEDAMTVTRVRPSLILQPDAASEISRYFLGHAIPLPLVHPALARFLPWPRALRVQFVHAADVADALVRVVEAKLPGGVNLAGEPVITRTAYAHAFGGVGPPAPPRLVRGAATLSWRLRLQPTDAGWFDLGMNVPLLKTDRARRELGWAPRHDAEALLREFVHALHERRGAAGPLLYRRRPL